MRARTLTATSSQHFDQLGFRLAAVIPEPAFPAVLGIAAFALAQRRKCDQNGRKGAFDVLYADGHVRTLVTREQGFKAARMRRPG